MLFRSHTLDHILLPSASEVSLQRRPETLVEKDGSCRPVRDDVTTKRPCVISPTESSPSMWVHPKFSHFFLCLWVMCKVEFMVKSYTKVWLEKFTEGALENDLAISSSSAQVEGYTVQRICHLFAQNEDIFKAGFLSTLNARSSMPETHKCLLSSQAWVSFRTALF